MNYVVKFLLTSFLIAPSLADKTRYKWGDNINWLIGSWHSQFDGKMVWPTVPTLTYGESLTLEPAAFSRESGIPMLKLSAYSWSHSTKDHLLDTYGYMTVDPSGNATLITTMNNGFSTLEKGPATRGVLDLRMQEIGRMSIARQLPVEDMSRQFRQIDNNYMEQIISMRTTQHPHSGMQEHARILYENMSRQFRQIDNNYMEQIISMRTTQHPHAGMQEHARILYEKVRPEPSPWPSSTSSAGPQRSQWNPDEGGRTVEQPTKHNSEKRGSLERDFYRHETSGRGGDQFDFTL